jgi:hypothetical protein
MKHLEIEKGYIVKKRLRELEIYCKEKATGVRDILPVTTILKKVRGYSRLEYI